MSKHMLFRLGLVCLVAVCLTEANGGRGAGGGRRVGKGPGKFARRKKGEEKGLKALQAELEQLKGIVEGLGEQPAEGTCGTNKVHFFFHDDNNDQSHDGHDEDDIHVHVDLHMAGGIGGGPGGIPAHFDGDPHDHDHSAVCHFENGYAYIIQNVRERFANFMFSFSKLAVPKVGLHVHENGDLRKGCGGLGGHYDPIDDKVDVGDLGSIPLAGESNIDKVWINDTKMSLIGSHTIVGRSIVGHDAKNNRIMCCVIGRSADDHSHDNHGNHQHERFHGHERHEGVGHASHGSHAHSHGGHDHASHNHDDHGHGHGHAH